MFSVKPASLFVCWICCHLCLSVFSSSGVCLFVCLFASLLGKVATCCFREKWPIARGKKEHIFETDNFVADNKN